MNGLDALIAACLRGEAEALDARPPRREELERALAASRLAGTGTRVRGGRAAGSRAAACLAAACLACYAAGLAASLDPGVAARGSSLAARLEAGMDEDPEASLHAFLSEQRAGWRAGQGRAAASALDTP